MTIRFLLVDTIAVALPYEIGGPKPLFAGVSRSMDILFVRVETDAGIVGWGEAFGFGIWPATRAALHALVAPVAVGRDERDIAGLMADLAKRVHIVGRTGPMASTRCRAWTLRCGTSPARPRDQAAGGPPPGGTFHRKLPCYASLMRYTDTALIAKNARAAVARGYGAVKLHEIGVEQVKAAREAIGPGVKLMMDTNCPWTVDEALAIADGVRPYDLAWFEEPIWPPEDFAGLAEVRTRGGIPIAAGENAMSAKNFDQMFEAHAVDIAQPSVTKIGGVSAMLEVAALAQKHHVRLVPHCPYFGPGLLASVHIAAAFAEETMIEYSFADLGANPLGDAIEVRDGYIKVPQGPGLGRDPDPEVLEKYGV